MTIKHYSLTIGIGLCAIAQLFCLPAMAQSDTPPEEVVVIPETTPSPIPASEVAAQSQEEGPPVTVYYSDGSAVATWTRGGVTQNVDIHPWSKSRGRSARNCLLFGRQRRGNLDQRWSDAKRRYPSL